MVNLDGNRGFVSCEANPARVIHWTLENGSVEPPQDKDPSELFTGRGRLSDKKHSSHIIFLLILKASLLVNDC